MWITAAPESRYTTIILAEAAESQSILTLERTVRSDGRQMAKNYE
jgi:hypothetical protein